MKLARTKQCAKCPWKKATDPHEIPNGYCELKHAGLKETIARPGSLTHNHAMACHSSKPGKEAHCIGWLMNQLGPRNNIALRMRMLGCENIKKVKLDGEQHRTFEETLP